MPRYIDADALKDVIKQYDYPLADKLNSIDNGMFTLGIFQAIDQMPTISPDEVRGVGEWIEDCMDYKCTACGKTVKDEIVYMLDPYQQPPFCPNCGAKMEVSE